MSRAKLWETIKAIWHLTFIALCLWAAVAIGVSELPKAWQKARDNFPVQIHVTIVPGGR